MYNYLIKIDRFDSQTIFTFLMLHDIIIFECQAYREEFENSGENGKCKNFQKIKIKRNSDYSPITSFRILEASL